MKKNLPQTNTILFDLDGTIIEPIEGILNSIRHAQKLCGNSSIRIISFIGPIMILLIKLSLDYEKANRCFLLQKIL